MMNRRHQNHHPIYPSLTTPLHQDRQPGHYGHNQPPYNPYYREEENDHHPHFHSSPNQKLHLPTILPNLTKLTSDELFPFRNIRPFTFFRQILAEFIGTMFLVFVACGSAIVDWNSSIGEGILEVALTFGMTVSMLILTFGHVSGCHINPCVSLAFAVLGKLPLYKAASYILFQCIGAICGAALLALTTTEGLHSTLGLTQPHEEMNVGQAVAIELLISFIFVMTVVSTSRPMADDVHTSFAPLVVGGAVTACHLFAVPYTGSGMNPARSLGPAVVLWEFRHHWIYWVGPLSGAVTGALMYSIFFYRPVDQ